MLEAFARKNFKEFMDYSVMLYGKPSKKIFSDAIYRVRLKIKNCLKKNKKDLIIAGIDLLNSLPNKIAKKQINLPDKKDISVLRKYTLGEFGKILNFKNTKKTFFAPEIKMIFEKNLKNAGIIGWKVELDPVNGVSVYVDQKRRRIVIPMMKKIFRNGLRHLLIHEIGTHVIRRINGEKSRLGLLGLGLDNVEIAEEGIATVREQMTDRAPEDFSGIEGFLAVSFAMGLDGKRRNFRETFELMKKYYLFNSLFSGERRKCAEKYANLTSWDRCVRTFRGTDYKTPGICFTKDIIYREGNIGIWNVIRKKPEEIKRFSVGKYDPSNPEHIRILDKLGIK